MEYKLDLEREVARIR